MKVPLFSLIVLILFSVAPGVQSTANGQNKPAAHPKKSVSTSKKKPATKQTAQKKTVPAKRPAVVTRAISVTATSPNTLTTTADSMVNDTTKTVVVSTSTASSATASSLPGQSRPGLLSLLNSGFTATRQSYQTGNNGLDRLFATGQGDTIKYTRYGIGAALYLQGGLMATLTRSTGKGFTQIGIGAKASNIPGASVQYMAALGAGIRLNQQIRIGGQISLTRQKINGFGIPEKNLTTPGVGIIGIYTLSQKIWLQATANTSTGSAIGFTYFL